MHLMIRLTWSSLPLHKHKRRTATEERGHGPQQSFPIMLIVCPEEEDKRLTIVPRDQPPTLIRTHNPLNNNTIK